jgi:hypothetical protein
MVAIAAGAGAMILAPAARAQTVTVEQLQSALRERDQQILALEKRIAALENKQATAEPAAATAAPTISPANPPAKVAGAASREQDEVALTAMSRGLVERGVLLLPRGSVEISPGISYGHSQKQGLVLVETPEGISSVSDQRQRDDALEFAATARVGLPWRSQIQLRVPFDWKREASALGDGSEVSHHSTHPGDIELELSHQFLVEKGSLPALLGAVSWRFPTGQDPYRVPVTSIASGGGTHQLTARLTALKTLDPLVFFTSLSYSKNFERQESFGRVHPGDFVAWQLGALLAVSPDTSLDLGFSQQFKFHTHVDGEPIRGSDSVAAVVQVGVDQVLSAHTLLNVSLGLGVTNDAPDYQLLVSLPFRF